MPRRRMAGDRLKGSTKGLKMGEHKDRKGGLTQKGVDKINRETGSNLRTAVTKDPSKIKPGSKDDKRRKSFCSRMGGMKGPMKDEKGRPTRKALALKKWNC